jgi:hypothetical protein
VPAGTPNESWLAGAPAAHRTFWVMRGGKIRETPYATEAMNSGSPLD